MQLKTKMERNRSKKEGNLRDVNYTALFYCIDFVMNHCQYSKWNFFAMLQFKENLVLRDMMMLGTLGLWKQDN